MKETIIFLTAALRIDNLKYICKTIENQYNKYIDKFDIRWLICKDQYNGFGDFDKFIKYINKTNINYKVIDSGKPNQKNYGGDIFNEPLIKYVTEENLDNPWIYVLDDDNILHPRLLKIFEQCFDNNFYGNKEIITTINKWHCGHNREIDKQSFLQTDKNNFIREWFLFDPSSVILRYNIIKKYKYFSNDFLYDFNWLNIPLLQSEQENIIWYNDYDNSFGRHLIGSYHNALVHNEDIDKFKDLDNLNIDVILYDDNIELPQIKPILTNTIKQKIIDLIKKEIKDYDI